MLVFLLEQLILAALTVFLLHQYGNIHSLSWYVISAVLVGWYFSFSIVCILPADVSASFYRQCLGEAGTDPALQEKCTKPWSYIPENFLFVFWQVIYWVSLPLTWVVFPMMESYVRVGDFSFWGKIKTSLKENILVYGSFGIIFGLLLVYLAAANQFDVPKLRYLIIESSNTWGLFLLILLMGYGLVEVPRGLWNNTRRERKLRSIEFKVAKIRTEMEDARDYLRDITSDVKWISEKIRYHDPLRVYVDIIVKKCPLDTSEESYRGDSERTVDDITMATLVSLHRKLMSATRTLMRTETQWEEILDQAFDLEDVIQNEKNPERKYRTYFPRTSRGRFDGLYLTAEWYWKVHLEKIATLCLAALCTVFSLALIWSEVTFWVKDPTLSLYALVLHGSGSWGKYVNVELISFITLLYMSVCTYSTLFRVRLLDYYYFVPNHHTDQGSLIFSALMVSRLTIALCLNFLSLNHLDGYFVDKTKEQTIFTQCMGQLKIISEGFNIYFPAVILLVVLCTYFSLGSRLMACLAMEQFMFNDDISNEYILEGKQLIKLERRRRERAERLLNHTILSPTQDRDYHPLSPPQGSFPSSKAPFGAQSSAPSSTSTPPSRRVFGRANPSVDHEEPADVEFDSDFAVNAVRDGRFSRGKPQRNLFSDV